MAANFTDILKIQNSRRKWFDRLTNQNKVTVLAEVSIELRV